MSCPKFIDFTRECLKEIETLPENTLDYCTTEKYVDCPFYKILSGDKKVCKNILKCPAFKNFKLLNFSEFVEIAAKYCVSENHKNCKRYILKEKGEAVPINLHPDGRTIDEWK